MLKKMFVLERSVLFTALCILIILCSDNVKANTARQSVTNITENITQNTKWDISGSPYHISGNIQVYPDITLTINPGVEVRFNPDASLEIGGELIARGTPEDNIIFTSNSATPSVGDWGRIVFKKSAVYAKYKPGDRPNFLYDYSNHQVLLEYASGSILEYCVVEYAGGTEAGWGAIKAIEGSYPCIMHSIIRYCRTGISVTDASSDSSVRYYLPRWFFFFDNLVKDCGGALFFDGSYGQGRALISGNTFRDGGRASEPSGTLHLRGYGNCIFLFNNQIFGNSERGITSYRSNPMLFLEHNVISHNYQGVTAYAESILLHNYITENRWLGQGVLGGGVYLAGRGLLFNNTIQLNGVNQGGHGDGIALSAEAVIRYNNLGNSVWDMYDIYFAPWPESDESDIVVDATENSWMTSDPSTHIYDNEDDMLCGKVNYEPVAASAMIPVPLDTYPTLSSPADNDYLQTNSPTFSWNPVDGATRYILCTFGKTWGNKSLNQNIEVNNATSFQVNFNLDGAHSMVNWFVVAGNDDGWSLPSEIRQVTLSTNLHLMQGRVIDENESPVDFVHLRGTGNPSTETLSSEDGGYVLMIDCEQSYIVSKEGYVTCYTFPRNKEMFDVTSDITIISIVKRDSIYNACGITYDPKKGTVAGVVVDENDQALVGAKVNLDSYLGDIYYLDNNGNPDFTLTNTGPSGKFVMLNVNHGSYEISATLKEYSFSATISVYEDAVTIDALIGSSINILTDSVKMSKVYSFPNPWMATSGEPITISHLTENAKVRIYTVTAELVKELYEQNGIVLWDATNEDGQDVTSGLYIFYAWDGLGNQTTGKIAVLR